MNLFPAELEEQASTLIDCCRSLGLTVALAESCTGGLAAGLFTSIAGSSDVFERGFVTYSNAAKVEMLGIPEQLISSHGAVSEEVARAMAERALALSHATIAASVTGVAGPGGGTVEKPVGRVHVAAARQGAPTHHIRLDLGPLDRNTVRLSSIAELLRLIRLQALGP